MALTRPVVDTEISASLFGQPVYDWIAENTPTAWTTVTYQNGWSTFDTRPAQYRKIGTLGYLRGVIKGGTSATIAFTLPAGFRPYQTAAFFTPAAGGAAFVTVGANGTVLMEGLMGGTVGWMYLDACCFSTVA